MSARSAEDQSLLRQLSGNPRRANCAPGREPLLNQVCETVTALEQALCQRLGAPRFNLWFAQKTKLTWDNEQLTIGVPNHFVQEWLQKAFADDLQAAGREVLGR